LQAHALVGNYQVSSVEHFSDQGTLHPFGHDPQGFLMYSAEGLMSAVLMASDRPNLAMDLLQGTSTATDAETAAAFRSGYGFAGTYEITGSEITHSLLVSTMPNWVGTTQVRPFELEGDLLTLYPPNWRLRARRWPTVDEI
jgi:Lipocalin-like domain